jgi:hypothetical protein
MCCDINVKVSVVISIRMISMNDLLFGVVVIGEDNIMSIEIKMVSTIRVSDIMSM